MTFYMLEIPEFKILNGDKYAKIFTIFVLFHHNHSDDRFRLGAG